jgi:hypothetical protein
MNARIAFLVLVGALAGGCSKNNGADGLSVGAAEDAGPLDHPAVTPPASVAAPRRLSVAQLQASLPVVFGNDAAGAPITWRLPGGREAIPSLARTLGQPDYITTTDEALEPSVTYAKFIDDAARSACAQALDADSGRTDAKARTILRFVEWADTPDSNADAFAKNVRYLKLRFHGIRLDDGDTSSVAPLATLFSAAVQGTAGSSPIGRTHVKEGWRAVCVALVTAPEFQLY